MLFELAWDILVDSTSLRVEHHPIDDNAELNSGPVLSNAGFLSTNENLTELAIDAVLNDSMPCIARIEADGTANVTMTVNTSATYAGLCTNVFGFIALTENGLWLQVCAAACDTIAAILLSLLRQVLADPVCAFSISYAILFG